MYFHLKNYMPNVVEGSSRSCLLTITTFSLLLLLLATMNSVSVM